MVSKKQPGSEPDSTAGSHIPEAEKDILKGPSLTESHLYNELLHSILRNASDIIYHTDRQGYIVFVSEAVRRYGYDPSQVVGSSIMDYVHPDDLDLARYCLNERRTGERATKALVIRLFPPSGMAAVGVCGSPVFSVNAEGLYKSGKICTESFLGTQGVARDITEYKDYKSRLRLQSMVLDQIQDFVTLTDLEGNITYVNDAETRLFNKSRDELLGSHVSIYGEDPSKGATQREILESTLSSGKWRGEVVNILPDGSKRVMDCRTHTILDESGRPIALCGISTDITGRKQIEDALRENNANLAAILENTNDLIASRDRDGRLVAFNSAFAGIVKKLFGIEARPGLRTMDYLPTEQKAHWEQIIQRVLSGEIIREEFQWDFGDKDVRHYEISFNPIIKDGEIIGISEFNRDITGRKDTQATLEEEALRRRILIEQSRDGIVVLDEDGKVFESNRSFSGMLGYSEREIVQLHVWDWDARWEREKLLDMIREVGVKGDFFETLHRRKDGTVIKVEISSTGAVIGGRKLIFCVCRDITERKLQELALQKSQERLESIFRVSPIGIGVVKDRVIQAVNNRLCEMTGYAPDELNGKSARILYVTDEDFEHVGREKYNQIRENGAGTVETRWKRKDGVIIDVLLSSTPLKQSDLSAGVTFTALDITERKQAEQALRDSDEKLSESNQQMSAILEYTHMLTAYLDMRFDFIWVNRAYAESGGQDPSFFPGRNHFDLYPNEENRAIFQKVVDIGKPFFISAKPFVYKDQPERGVTYWDWSLVPVKSAEGKVTGLILTLADVTGIRKAEEELRRSEWRLLEAQRVAHIGNWEPDIRTRKLWWSEEVYRIFGFEHGGFDGTMEAFFDCIHPEDKQRMEDVTMAAWNDRQPFNVDHRIVLPDGAVRTVHERAEMVFEEDGEPAGMIGTVQDITERKIAEEKLRRTNELLSSIREAQAEYISDSDQKAVFSRLLKTMVSLTGSQFGFLDEVLMAPDGKVYKKSLAISDISWDEHSRKMYRELEAGNLEFHNMLNLAGLPALDGKLLISNDPAGDMHRGGLPEGHPSINSFMGIPMFHGGEILGVMGLANRPGGFSKEDAAFLEPFNAACAGLIHSLREQREKQAQQEEIRRAEQALRESDARIRAAADSSLDAFMILRSVRDEQGQITDFEFVEVNGRTEQLVRKSRDELVGHRLCEVLPINRTAGFFEKYRKVAESGIPLEEEFSLPETSVPAAWYHHQVVKVGDGVAISHRDITRRKRSEEALLSLVLETTGPTGRDFFERAVWWLSRWLGAEVAIISEQGEDGVQRSLAMQLDGHPVSRYEYQLAGTPCEKVSQNGFCHYVTGVNELFPDAPHLVKFSIKGYAGIPMRNGAGKTLGVICVLSRGELILPPWAEPLMKMLASRAAAELERLRAEDDLRESEERMGFVLSGSGMGWWEWNYKTGKVKRSQGWADLLGYTFEEAQRPSLWPEILHPEDKLQLDQAVDDHLSGRIDSIEKECRVRSKSGERLWLVCRGRVMERDAEGNPVRLSGTIHNVTEQKRLEVERLDLERQLQQAQKLESLGVLAGGIAHDFNNILGIISGYAELAESDVTADPTSVAESLQQVRKAAERAKGLTSQILAFSRQSELERIPLKFSLLVKEAVKMLRASIPSTVEIVKSIGNETGMVIADPNQLHQVLMNLATNAAHAMRERGGTLTFNLSECKLDAVSAAGLRLSPGCYLKLSVGDTGHGIDPSIISRIFDPFFTTKPKGQGTGMGLAVVHGIVRGHGGTITVASEPGRGTVFDVYLPLVQAEAEKTKDGISQVAGGKERILLVDDEVSLVTVGRKQLTRLGYTLTAMTSSLEALAAFEADPMAFDLVITDQTMPVLTGARLAEKLLEIRPGLPVILCTGFSDNLTPEALSKIGIRELVMKPFRWDEMTALIRKVLENR